LISLDLPLLVSSKVKEEGEVAAEEEEEEEQDHPQLLLCLHLRTIQLHSLPGCLREGCPS